MLGENEVRLSRLHDLSLSIANVVVDCPPIVAQERMY